jgi:hypothetical protein
MQTFRNSFLSGGHPELDEDDDVGEGCGDHGGDGAPLGGEESEAGEVAGRLQLLVMVTQ